MDLLQDILKQSGLKSRFLGYRKISAATTLQFPCNKSMGFHVVTQGTAYIHWGAKKKPIEINSGDIVFAARGQDHFISTDKVIHSKVMSLGDFAKQSSEKSSRITTTQLTLVSGAYQIWNEPTHPVFSDLPEIFVLRANENQSFDSLHSLIAMLANETQSSALGSELILENILDILFALILRKVLAKCGAQPKTWSHALMDPKIKESIELMHLQWNHPWTLETLAKKIALSRAGFALRFKKVMGDTPLHYLTQIRMQKAMKLLAETSDSIEKIALAVGYQDAFGFSKTFKKISGLPPKEFRKKDWSERSSLGRF